MYENTQPWETSVPAELISAVKHLRKSFDETLEGCGHITGTMCYILLHNEYVDAPSREYIDNLLPILKIVGRAAHRRFNVLIEADTPSAVFKAYCDLYLAFAGTQVVSIFKELTKIGRVHGERLDVPYLEWAESQTKDLIRSNTHRISQWVRDVCDKEVDDAREGPEERRKWQAPTFLTMKPLRDKPYDAATDWERNDAGVSSQWLEYFKDHYVLTLESNLQRASGEAALELARQSTPIITGAAENVIVAKTSPNYGPTHIKREARKLDTQTKHERWQKQYRTIKKLHPEKTDVWCSQQISKSSGDHAETIRKNMKK
jgi:hypothetical protein